MPRNAIGAFLGALFVGIVTYLFLGKVPEIGDLLYTLGWIVTVGLVLLGIYWIFAGRTRA